MVTPKLADDLADLFELIRHEGILLLEDSECKSAVFTNLDEEEKLYFETVAAAIINGAFESEELQIINQNAKVKCKTKNVLLDTFFDLFLLYWKNVSDKKNQARLKRKPEKLKDIAPVTKDARRILRLLANEDRSKCGEILNKPILEHRIRPDWEVLEKLHADS